MEMTQWATYGIVLAVAAAILSLGLINAMDKQDAIDCQKWAQEASTLTNFYLTPAQAETCRQIGVKVTAPTRN